MTSVISILIAVTVLLAVTLFLDALLARRWPLAIAALWNATLVSALVLAPAVWLLPRWELALLPAEVVVVRAPRDVAVAAVQQPEMRPTKTQAQSNEKPSLPRASQSLAPASVRPARPWDLRWALLAVYLAGAALALVRLLGNAVSVVRLRQRALPLTSAAWRMQLDAWRETAAPCRRVTLLQSAEVAVPIAIGWWRPAIVVPADLVEECETVTAEAAATIDAVLVHELAHVERGDCGWQLVERVVHIVYWFHPLLWLAQRRIAQVRERACDDFAVHLLDSPHVYAETLVSVAARIGARRRLGLAMAVVRTSNLEKRLSAIAESEGDARCRLGRSARWGLLCALLLIVACGTTARLVRAQGAKPSAIAIAGKAKTWQEEHAEQFAELVKAGKFDEAAEMFSPELRKHWPADKLEYIFGELAAQFGRLRDHSFILSERVGNTQLTALMLVWGKQLLSVRLIFDDAKRIDGVWFAQHPAVDPIAAGKASLRFEDKVFDLRADELLLGKDRPELSKANLSLEIDQLQANGEPVTKKTFISFYRALNAGEAAEPNDWHDTKAGVTWRFISNESRQQNRADRLLPGTYRAFIASNKETGYQLSEPIKLDGSQQLTKVELRAKPTATLLAHVVDAQTGEGLEHFDLRIQADDPMLPSYRSGSSDFEKPEVRIDGLLPGRHRITSFRKANRIGERDYAQIDVPQYVELEAGKTTEATVKLRAAVMTDGESAHRWPFEVHGRVVDNDGKPVEGAQLTAWSGIATLFQTGKTSSDADGRYSLKFGPGYWTDSDKINSNAIVRVAKAGLYDVEQPQANKLTLVNRIPEPEKGAGRTFVLPRQPHELNFVLAPAVGISAEFEDETGRRWVGESVSLMTSLPRSRTEVTSGKTSAEGSVAATGVAPRRPYNWTVSAADPFPTRSTPFEFPEPGNYRMVLQVRPDMATGSRVLKIKQVVDTSGKDVTAAVVQDDPTLREPLPEELQQACHEIVAKMLAANKLWLEAPPAEVDSYQFDVHFDAVPEGQKSRVTYLADDLESIDPAAQHGITYVSPLPALKQRENVVFRALEVTPGRTVLAYTFKQPARIQAGNGVENYWRGSIATRSREGILVIDSQRNVPLELQGDAFHEHFEDYREVAPGEFAPQRVRIDVDNNGDFGWGFDWRFAVYEPRLWLLSESRDARTPNSPPVMTVDNVQVNGEAAKRMELD